MIEVSEELAEAASKSRGHYSFLKTVGTIQLATALDAGAKAFLTKDAKFTQFKELKVLVLKDYLHEPKKSGQAT